MSSSSGSAIKNCDFEGVVVVGSGLAGLTTTLQLLQKGIPVTILEKTARFGGNSAKASSGINGVPTKFQPTDADSVEHFKKDTIKSGKGLSNLELVDVLTQRSASAIDWLTGEDFNIDLSSVAKLGGHTYARTHRGSGKLPPGFAIISGLTKKLESLSSESASKLTIHKEAALQKLIVDNGSVKGIEYVSGPGQTFRITSRAVVLATGGYSANFDSEQGWLKKYRPDLLHLPSTNGEQTTGDGQKIAVEYANANLIHMDQVQVHPTGFIQLKKDDPIASASSKWKFLCGELIRGIGGILISPVTGERFVNELTTRDVVTDAINTHCQINENNFYQLEADKNVALIVVSAKDYPKAKNHIDFYLSQNLLFKGSRLDLLDQIKKLNSATTATLEAIDRTLKSYDASASDHMTQDPFGRNDFGNGFGQEDTLYYGLITPSLHFSMGGIEINKFGQVINQQQEIVNGLYAVGEVSGGLHGGNRLGGSSLLECVVFGTEVSKHIAQVGK